MSASSVDVLVQNLDEIKRRISSLEQTISAAGSLPPAPVVVSPPFGGPPLVLAGPEAGPANFHLSHHLSGSLITVEAQWSPVADAVIYEIEWATKNSDGTYTLVNSLRTIGTSAPFSLLSAATTYGFKVYAINNFGQYSLPSPSTGYLDITTSTDSVPPPAPTNVRLARGQTSVIVKFDPYDLTVVPDLQSYHIALSADGFQTQLDIYTTAFVVQFPNLEMGKKEWVARVSGIDTSNNEGPYSTSTNFPVSNSGGIVDQMMVGDFSAAHITFGSMLGDRIQTNSLSAQTLKTSTLTASDITLNGGAFVVGTPLTGTGMLINSQGLRLYNSGAIEMALDALTGSATFSGTITGATINGGTINGATITGLVLNGITINGVTINAGTINAVNFYGVFPGSTRYVSIVEGGSGGGGEIHVGDSTYDVSGGFIRSNSGSGVSSTDIASPEHYYTNRASVSLRSQNADPFSIAYLQGNAVNLMTDDGSHYFASFDWSGISQIFTNNNIVAIGINPTAMFLYAGGYLQFDIQINSVGCKSPFLCDVYRGDTLTQFLAEGSTFFLQDVGGSIVDLYADTGECDINGNVYAPSFNVTSSRSLKKNIAKIVTPVLDQLSKIDPVTFEFNEKPGIRLGLIAEEVMAQWPEAASIPTPPTPPPPRPGGAKHLNPPTPTTPTIDLGAMVALLVKGLKELDSRLKVVELK